MTGESAKEKESETRARFGARARARARTHVCVRETSAAAASDSRPVAASGLKRASKARYRARRADRRPIPRAGNRSTSTPDGCRAHLARKPPGDRCTSASR